MGLVARSAIDDCFSLATIGRPQPQYDVLEKTQALMILKSLLAMFNTRQKMPDIRKRKLRSTASIFPQSPPPAYPSPFSKIEPQRKNEPFKNVDAIV